MTIEPMQDYTPDLEQRVSTLETELALVKKTLAQSTPSQTPWWLEVAGSFENDPTFDEAVELGREWRKSEQ